MNKLIVLVADDKHTCDAYNFTTSAELRDEEDNQVKTVNKSLPKKPKRGN